MIGSEIFIRLDPQSMRTLRELTEAMNRPADNPLGVKPTSLVCPHVHCESCGCVADLRDRSEIPHCDYRCRSCGACGTRDDRGERGAIRWVT